MKARSSSLAAALLVSALLGSLCVPAAVYAQQAATAPGSKQMSLADLRAWKSIRAPSVSPDGEWLAYQIAPNDGDATVVIRATHDTTEWRFPVGDATAGGRGGGRGGRGGRPSLVTISGDSRWAVFNVAPPQEAARGRSAQRSTGPNGSNGRKTALVDLATGKEKDFDGIARFLFAGDHPRWLALLRQPQRSGAGGTAASPAGGGGGGRGGAGAAPA
ncbi:MAG: hypothetical protein LJF04_15440, partial [Gemmatimonadetes bacterium]|nr:hypothetical protein [Gemmatimonadota bacterium]